jgi:hypothetical protein
VAPQIVDQCGAVKQLAIERLAVERRQRHAPHPGPIRMGDEQIELLRTRCLGLTREPRVGRLEVAHVDARCAIGQPPERQLHAPEDVDRLGHRDRAEQATSLRRRQLAAGAPSPLEAAEPVGVGDDHVAIPRLVCGHFRASCAVDHRPPSRIESRLLDRPVGLVERSMKADQTAQSGR